MTNAGKNKYFRNVCWGFGLGFVPKMMTDGIQPWKLEILKTRTRFSWALRIESLTRWHRVYPGKESENSWHWFSSTSEELCVQYFGELSPNVAERYYTYVPIWLGCCRTADRQEFNQWHSIHWGIECYHRASGIERFMVDKCNKNPHLSRSAPFTVRARAEELLKIGTRWEIYTFK